MIKDLLQYPLKSESRNGDLPEQILNLQDGNHLCLFYDGDPGEQLPALVPFIQQGLARNEQFIYIVDDHTMDDLTDRLEEQGIDVDAETERGRLKLWTRAEWRQPGQLCSNKKAAQVRGFIDEAASAGFRGIRFAVEMTWTLGPNIAAAQLEHWEATINTLFVPTFPGRIICQYNRSRLSPDAVLAALHTHPLVILGDEVHSNLFYQAPLILDGKSHDRVEQGKKDTASRVEWMLSQLKKFRAAEKERIERAQQKRAEQRLDLQYTVSQILADAVSVSDASSRVLQTIGESIGWEMGALWCMDPERREISCSELWTSSTAPPVALPATSRQRTFKLGEGLVGRAWQSGKPVWITEFDLEMHFHRKAAAQKDGLQSCFLFPITIENEVVRVLEFFSVSAHPRNDEVLELLTSIGTQVGQFIERKRAEKALRLDLAEQKNVERASRHLAAIVESSCDAIVSKDLNGIISSWNNGAQRVFGYTGEEVIGKPITILIPHDRQDEEPAILSRIHHGECIEHFETIRRRKDGSLVDISLTISPIKDGKGNIIGISKIARDITEQKRAERLLQKTTELLAKTNEELETRVQQRTASLQDVIAQMEEFSYSVSHDLRSPVRAMQGYARAVIEDYGNRLDPKGRDYLERIVRSGHRMDRLIQDILTFSRINQRDIHLQRVSLDKLAAEIIHQYPEMQSPRAEITVSRPLADVTGHEPSLTQVVSNLLSNAIKFVEPGDVPCVRLWTELVEGEVRLWVADHGIGIHPQYQPRLFGMFERVHSDKKYEGTGIGLAIVRRAVERMGGKVGMESDGIHGSKFWIQLPAGL